MVSLGSSFASGPGLPPYEDRSAARSTRNAAHLVAARIGAELTDVSAGGATTASIWPPDAAASTERRAAQIDAIRMQTDLVTITVGGNDLGYLATVYAAAIRKRLHDLPILGRMLDAKAGAAHIEIDSARTEALTTRVADIVHEIQLRAPRALVVIAGYLPIVPPHPIPVGSPFAVEDEHRIRELADALDVALHHAADRAAVSYVDMSSRAAGHELGSADPWIAPLHLSPTRFPASFHPTASGMRGIADEILAVLDGLDGWSPSAQRS